MTENSTSASTAVGCDVIDTYLNAVEEAMIAAHAPRADRLQVLQDLEAQIADMIAQLPQPLTEESVHAVMVQLEPPSHFAANYAGGQEVTSTASTPAVSIPRTHISWTAVAAAACGIIWLAAGLLFLGVILGVDGGALRTLGPIIDAAVVLTPITLWFGARQMRSAPARSADRILFMRTTAAYAIAAPALVFLVLTGVTQGYILYAAGVAGFFYAQYVLVRRLWQRLDRSLPPAPTAGDSPAASISPPRAPAAPMSFSTALSMPAI
jgi:hypothetical protein